MYAVIGNDYFGGLLLLDMEYLHDDKNIWYPMLKYGKIQVKNKLNTNDKMSGIWVFLM